MSDAVRMHHPCDRCGSSDAATTYSSGWTKCFSCGDNYRQDGEYEMREEKRDEGLLSLGEFKPLPSRKLQEKTCAKYGYHVSRYGTRPCQVSDFRRNGKVVAQHLRYPGKEFSWLGRPQNVEMFGQHLWAEGGKSLIICEGEIDTMSWAQVRELRWPVCGITGTGSIKQIKDNIEYICSFDEVYIYTDMDDPGRSLAYEIAELLPPGLARIGNLPRKDVNETLVEDGAKVLYNTLWQAKPYAPEEVVSFRSACTREVQDRSFYTYPIEPMQEKTNGHPVGELVVFGAGTSVGKSSLLRYLAWDCVNQGRTIGYIPLEESSLAVARSFLGMSNNMSYIEAASLSNERVNELLCDCTWPDNIVLYDHKGRAPGDILFSRIRHMRVANECKIIFIDHLSAVFAHFEKDERKQIDKFMYQLHSLCKELGILVFTATHLTDPKKGKSLEEGGTTSMSLSRGSGSIKQVPDTYWGIERDSLSDDKHKTRIVSHKQRFNPGATGYCCTLTMEVGGLFKELAVGDYHHEYFEERQDKTDDF